MGGDLAAAARTHSSGRVMDLKQHKEVLYTDCNKGLLLQMERQNV